MKIKNITNKAIHRKVNDDFIVFEPQEIVEVDLDFNLSEGLEIVVTAKPKDEIKKAVKAEVKKNVKVEADKIIKEIKTKKKVLNIFKKGKK